MISIIFHSTEITLNDEANETLTCDRVIIHDIHYD